MGREKQTFFVGDTVWWYRYLTDGVAEAKRTGKILSIDKYLNTGVITCVKMLEAQSLRYTVTYTNECNASREVIMSAAELYATAAAAKKAFYSALLSEPTELDNELAALIEKIALAQVECKKMVKAK